MPPWRRSNRTPSWPPGIPTSTPRAEAGARTSDRAAQRRSASLISMTVTTKVPAARCNTGASAASAPLSRKDIKKQATRSELSASWAASIRLVVTAGPKGSWPQAAGCPPWPASPHPGGSWRSMARRASGAPVVGNRVDLVVRRVQFRIHLDSPSCAALDCAASALGRWPPARRRTRQRSRAGRPRRDARGRERGRRPVPRRAVAEGAAITRRRPGR